jgi:hypothetical protein
MSQVIFAVACVLFSPHKEVVLYTLTTPTNTTELRVHETPVHIQAALGLLSFLAFFFAMQTMNSLDNGGGGGGGGYDRVNIDYNLEFIEQNGMWDMLFWVYVLGSHLLTFAIILNVGDLYLLASSTFLVQYCLYHACLPRNSSDVSVTRENMYLLGYAGAIFVVGYNAQTPTLLLWVVLIDYALGVGHAWDKQATVDTVVNCRLFYACCQSLLICVFYTWEPITHSG